MTKRLTSPPAPVVAEARNPAAENPAIARCCAAYAQALEAATLLGKSRIFAALDAASAYRKAMPPLAGDENICDFIACVAHAMLIGAISTVNGSKLLYAAQVAHGARRTLSSRQKSTAA